MPAPFGPTIPIRSPRCAARNGTGPRAAAPPTAARRRPRPAPAGSRRRGPRSGRRSRRSGPARHRERAARQPQLARALRRLDPLGLEALEACLVLVHLRELAVAAVALDELPLAGDRLGVRLGVLGRPRVALLALAVVGAVVAAERRQPAVAQLPDPGHGRVEERPVVRGDEQRAAAAPEVLLEPLERVEVEVVRRLVEEQQVRVGDHEPGQRGARLLAARQRGRRPGPLVRARSRGRTAPRRRAGRACSRRAPRTRCWRSAYAGSVDAMPAARARRARPPSARGAPRPGRTAVRRSGAAMNAASKCASWASRPSVRPRLRCDLAAVGLVEAGRDPQQRRLAGAVRADEADPVAQRDRRRRCESRMTNVPTSRGTPSSRRIDIRRSAAAAERRAPPPGGSRPPAASAPSAPRAAVALRRRQPDAPLPAAAPSSAAPRRSGDAGHRRAGSPRRPARSAAGSRWHHEQKCVARAPTTIRRIGRPQRGHGSPARW